MIPMAAQDTSRLKRLADREIVEHSQELQNRLLGFRFDSRPQIKLADVPDAERSLSPRRRDLLSALAAPFEPGSEWPDLLLQCFANTEQDAGPSLPPDKAAVLDGLWDLCHRRAGYTFISIAELRVRIREMHKGADQKILVSPGSVGKIMRNNFGFPPPTHTNSGNGFWLGDRTRSQIHNLVDKDGLELPPHPSIATAKERCTFCREPEAGPAPAETDEMLKDLEEPESEAPQKRRRLFDDL